MGDKIITPFNRCSNSLRGPETSTVTQIIIRWVRDSNTDLCKVPWDNPAVFLSFLMPPSFSLLYRYRWPWLQSLISTTFPLCSGLEHFHVVLPVSEDHPGSWIGNQGAQVRHSMPGFVLYGHTQVFLQLCYKGIIFLLSEIQTLNLQTLK